MRRNSRTHKFDAARKMPPLYHSIPGQPFDIRKSQVVQWLISQPDILSYIFTKAGIGTKSIHYNPTTGKWQEADYDD